MTIYGYGCDGGHFTLLSFWQSLNVPNVHETRDKMGIYPLHTVIATINITLK